MIDSSLEPQDSRATDAEAMMQQIKSGLLTIDSCLHAVPDDRKEQVREALRDAVVVGGLFRDLQVQQPHVPIDDEGQIVLGRALRAHLRRVQDIQKESSELRRAARNILGDDQPSSAA